MPPREEVFLPFESPRDHPPPLVAVRGQTIASSMKTLHKRDLFDAYRGNLTPTDREQLLGLTASTWAPLALADAHYRACDRLALDRTTLESIGADAGLALNETAVSVLIKLSKEAGATPWTVLTRGNKLMHRSWEGSTVGVFKLGPKEARFEWIGQPLAVIPYVRVAFCGFLRSVLELFATRVFVKDIPACCTRTTLGYRCSWV